jgi:hypothetical protein
MSTRSSERKRINLRTLVQALGLRDIGCVGASELLGCSASASRYYLAELREAGLVSLRAARPGIDSPDRKAYTLSADPAAVRDFLDSLAEPPCTTGLQRRNCAHIHRTWRAVDDAISEVEVAGRRDPLVAALFGTVES